MAAIKVVIPAKLFQIALYVYNLQSITEENSQVNFLWHG
jgi:hypothetical protein